MRDSSLFSRLFHPIRAARLCALAGLILSASLSLAVIPACYAPRAAGGGYWMVFLLGFSVFALGSLFLYSKHRDPFQMDKIENRYAAYHFLYDPHVCKTCGTRTILIFPEGAAPLPVPPNTRITENQRYFCPHCKKAMVRSACGSVPVSLKKTPRAIPFSGPDVYRNPPKYLRFYCRILLGSLFLCIITSLLLRFHMLLLLPWWGSLYLLFLSAYHTWDCACLRYRLSSEGIYQNSAGGDRLLSWRDIHAVVCVRFKGNDEPAMFIFGQTANWILSPVLCRYKELYARIKDACAKEGISFGAHL